MAVLHEYKSCWDSDKKEEKELDAIWQCLTSSNLKCVSEGQIIIKGKKSNWSEVRLRGIAFQLGGKANWRASSIEFTLTLKQVKDILEIFACFEKEENFTKQEYLSGNIGARDEIEKERALFLKENKVGSLFEIIKATPFRYQQTQLSQSKAKAGFSSVKLGFSPLLSMSYSTFDPSKCYPLSPGSSWNLKASCFKPTQQRSNLLKASLMMRSLKLFSKVL